MNAAGGPPLALTLGEPAGIGPDLTLAVWKRRVELDLPPCDVIGDAEFYRQRATMLGLDVPVAVVTPKQANATFARALPVVALDAAVTARPGRPDNSSAPAAIASIKRAVADVMAGDACGVVTNPIAKSVLYRGGFAEPGHTEYLARLAAEATGQSYRPVMLLWSNELAVVPVTIHLPLKDVVSHLSTQLIVDTGRIVAHDLAARFGIARPRIAVAGLNPHAGEGGLFGREEVEIISPAIADAKATGIVVEGPYGADTMFPKKCDAFIVMLHDQGHITAKLLAPNQTAGIAIGTPILFSSVAHGSAYDIAGKGVASHAAMVEAIKRLVGAPAEAKAA